MLKKISVMLSVFIITVAANISISQYMHDTTIKNRNITVILQEFSEISGDEFSNQEIEYYIDDTVRDRRVAVLKAFFRKYDSPLYDHADFIVKVSDEYGLDYRLIPAISMQESTACKFIPHNSYNCWGWGIYGNKITRFNSYPEAIETIAKGLKKNYIDKGLTSPEQIMAKYTPSSNGSWARGVGHVLGVLE